MVILSEFYQVFVTIYFPEQPTGKSTERSEEQLEGKSTERSEEKPTEELPERRAVKPTDCVNFVREETGKDTKYHSGDQHTSTQGV